MHVDIIRLVARIAEYRAIAPCSSGAQIVSLGEGGSQKSEVRSQGRCRPVSFISFFGSQACRNRAARKNQCQPALLPGKIQGTCILRLLCVWLYGGLSRNNPCSTRIAQTKEPFIDTLMNNPGKTPCVLRLAFSGAFNFWRL
jgi:hypothetical protein